MKKTNNISIILLVILVVAILGTVLIKFLEYLFGSPAVFIAAIFSIPFLFIWSLTIKKNKNGKRN